MLPGRDPKAEAGKTANSKPESERVDPFLPYDEDFFVADVTDTHVCLLNKFTVVKHHLLIVTNEFVDQRTTLTLADFVATAACMAKIDGLVFYNAGSAAGASQRHRHMQIVPLLLAETGPPAPIEAAFGSDDGRSAGKTLPAFSFRHAFERLNLDPSADPLTTARALYGCYLSMLEAVGLHVADEVESDAELGPYKLLVTRRWMFVVPRRREAFAGIQVNALGFAGSLLARGREQLATIGQIGPMGILNGVAVPALSALRRENSFVGDRR
jgi:ATP adenylyltransferase